MKKTLILFNPLFETFGMPDKARTWCGFWMPIYICIYKKCENVSEEVCGKKSERTDGGFEKIHFFAFGDTTAGVAINHVLGFRILKLYFLEWDALP